MKTKLYHFTSLENLNKMLDSGDDCISPSSIYNGKKVTWLTKVKDRKHQYWAIGDNKGKADVRFTVSTLNFYRFDLPDNLEERQELVRLGAFDFKLWTEQWKLEIDREPSFKYTNWFISENNQYPYKIEIWNEHIGKYVSLKLTEAEEREYILDRMLHLSWTDWYLKRWNNFYIQKYNITEQEIEDKKLFVKT